VEKEYIMNHIMSEVSTPHHTFSETMGSLAESWTPEVSNLYEELSNEYRLEVQIRQSVARQLHDARQSAALTQAELSRLSGLPQPEISRIERGFANPTLTTLTKLASALQSSFQIEPLEEALIKHPRATTRNGALPPSSR
jgi:XRE family transcriptional regulator, regulator of sulfur utilization